ncbi:MAG TPA: acyl carrier protein [Novosphingobium sp.]|nr:acyl carrier protein [Novosphingobium sp.]HZV11308.1 acyl carrier protein [Novosphingobium sp.]
MSGAEPREEAILDTLRTLFEEAARTALPEDFAGAAIDSFGFDSIDRVDLIMNVEDTFRITITDAEAERFFDGPTAFGQPRCVHDLAALVATHIDRAAGARPA